MCVHTLCIKGTFQPWPREVALSRPRVRRRGKGYRPWWKGFRQELSKIGAATPVVAPLCVALLKAKGVVDEASRNKEELEELCERCDLITVQVIDKAKASNASSIDVSPSTSVSTSSRWWPNGTMTKGDWPGWRDFAETATTSRGLAPASRSSSRSWSWRGWWTFW